MNFRYDINGLRAIAVIAVVLFHFNPVWVPGGFAGVDVFFVISGFLMTGIIFRGLENNNFNLFKFYMARANRIIPALAVLCLILLVFGWFYFSPSDYKALGKHVTSSMVFLSNIIYWRESGYFDAASYNKWLLHTWSLSVEWQFYIIYPIALIVLKRFLSLKHLKELIVIGTILGFIFSVVATIKWPSPAYYLLPTRAWEMMMGGVAFLYPWNLSEKKSKLIEFVGLVLILSSYVFVSSNVPWPGHFAIIPVLGSYLMIVANQQSSIITNNVIFQYLGKWSYSIYLWHWPIVVFGYYYNLQYWFFVGIPLSIFLGYFSYNVIEKNKVSLLSFISFKLSYLSSVLIVTTLTGIATLIYYNQGFSSRLTGNAAKLYENQAAAKDYYQKTYNVNFANFFEAPYYFNDIEKTRSCILDQNKQTIESLSQCSDFFINERDSILVIGDSHSQDAYNALKVTYSEVNFVNILQSGCIPTQNKDCFIIWDEFYETYIKDNSKIKGIVFASRYTGSGMGKFITELNEGKYDDKFHIVINAGPFIEPSILRVYENDEIVNIPTNMNQISTNHLLNESLDKSIIIDKYSVFCEYTKCDIYDDKYEPYFMDSSHVSKYGIEKWSNSLKKNEVLKGFLDETGVL
ncbi:acyltransferase family protein [Aliivibrio sp. EL58]|uniref:acyltransferase family protein n=1 Tax=Aliivibrio sp. EL58 TaxID=2107582 RepID=UPI000EFB532E|nr:acyltransferase family protein [Aliivibrio sp. EL58]